MSFAFATLIAAVASAWIAWELRGPNADAVEFVQPAAADDGAPMADFDRILEDLIEIDALLSEGRIREACDEVERLIGVMEGRDEAAETDRRYREHMWQRINEQRATA